MPSFDELLKKVEKQAQADAQRAKAQNTSLSSPGVASTAEGTEPSLVTPEPDPTLESPSAEPQGAEGPNQQEAPPVDPDKEKKQALKQESEQAHRELVGLLPAAGKMVLQLKTFFEEKRKDLTEEDFEKTFKALFDEYVGIRTRYTNLKKKGDNLYDSYSSTAAKKREKVVADQKEVNEKIRAIITELEGIQGKVATAEEEVKAKQILDQLQNTPPAGMPEASVPGAPEAPTSVPSALPADPHLNTPFNRGQRRNRSEAEQGARDRKAAERRQERKEAKEKAERQKREEENRKKELERLQDKKNTLIQESTRVRSRIADLIAGSELPDAEKDALQKKFRDIEERRMALYETYDKALKDAQDDEARIAAHGPLLDGLPPITKEFEAFEEEVKEKVAKRKELITEVEQIAKVVDAQNAKTSRLFFDINKLIRELPEGPAKAEYSSRFEALKDRSNESVAAYSEAFTEGRARNHLEGYPTVAYEEMMKTSATADLEEFLGKVKEYLKAQGEVSADFVTLKDEIIQENQRRTEAGRRQQEAEARARAEAEARAREAQREQQLREFLLEAREACERTNEEIQKKDSEMAAFFHEVETFRAGAKDHELEKIFADGEALRDRYERAQGAFSKLASLSAVNEIQVGETQELAREYDLILKELKSIHDYVKQWLEKKEREIETLVGEELINDLAYTIREARAEYDEAWDKENDPTDSEKEKEWAEDALPLFKQMVEEEIASRIADTGMREQVFSYILKKASK